MDWNECIRQGIAKEAVPDFERAAHTTSMAMLRFEFWDRKIDPKFSALKAEAYYEIIKELIFAILYKNALTAQTMYALFLISQSTLLILIMRQTRLTRFGE